jgi:hypothetical protein
VTFSTSDKDHEANDYIVVIFRVRLSPDRPPVSCRGVVIGQRPSAQRVDLVKDFVVSRIDHDGPRACRCVTTPSCALFNHSNQCRDIGSITTPWNRQAVINFLG